MIKKENEKEIVDKFKKKEIERERKAKINQMKEIKKEKM